MFVMFSTSQDEMKKVVLGKDFIITDFLAVKVAINYVI
jgi:hypothetical protein